MLNTSTTPKEINFWAKINIIPIHTIIYKRIYPNYPKNINHFERIFWGGKDKYNPYTYHYIQKNLPQLR